MNRTILIPAVLLVLTLVAIVAMLFLRGSMSVPSSGPITLPLSLAASDAQMKAEVQTVVSKAANPADHPHLRETAVSGSYALQVVVGDTQGGEVLLKKEGSAWQIISWGGGTWSSEDLVAEGVPEATAKKLISGMSR